MRLACKVEQTQRHRQKLVRGKIQVQVMNNNSAVFLSIVMVALFGCSKQPEVPQAASTAPTQVVKLFLELSMPLIMLYNNRFSHGKAAIQ
jgi:hypothetical protein